LHVRSDISKNYLRPASGLGRPWQRKVRPAAAAFDLQSRTKSLDAVPTRVITGTSHWTVLLFLHLFLQQRPVLSLVAPRIPTSRCHTLSPGKMQTSLGVRLCDSSQKSTLFLSFLRSSGGKRANSGTSKWEQISLTHCTLLLTTPPRALSRPNLLTIPRVLDYSEDIVFLSHPPHFVYQLPAPLPDNSITIAITLIVCGLSCSCDLRTGFFGV